MGVNERSGTLIGAPVELSPKQKSRLGEPGLIQQLPAESLEISTALRIAPSIVLGAPAIVDVNDVGSLLLLQH